MKTINLLIAAKLFAILFFIALGCRQPDNIITSEEELLSLLNSQTYQYYQYGALPITDDIKIAGTITISTEQLNVPKDWVDYFYGDCRNHVGFSNHYDAEGIDLSANYWGMESWDMEFQGSIVPATLTLTDIILRFRPLIVNTHPSGIKNHTPVIFLIPPSDYQCADNQTKCDNDNVCYLNRFDAYQFSEYCLYCLGLSDEACACTYDNETHLSDGIDCSYCPPGDMCFLGTCQDGICEESY
jgi:hypothetical protein